jgi:hypothetical protein
MIRIDKLYDLYAIIDNPFYPLGEAKDTSTDDSVDGVAWKAAWFNTILGFFTAAIVEAVGSATVSGEPDKLGDSEILNALKTISTRLADENTTPGLILQRLKTIDGAGSGLDADLFQGKPPSHYLNQGIQFVIKPISGVETIIPAAELNLQYDSSKQYPLLITAAGYYPEFINFNAEMLSDGLHIRPIRFIDNELVPGTRTAKWGQDKWGAGRIYVSGKKWGHGLWGDGKWSAGRWVGGISWGRYAPMNINIIIKEL